MLALICATSGMVTAQSSFFIHLPDVQIMADRITCGDGDTYGLGDWQCAFTATLEGTYLLLTGTIIFAEKANDLTTIIGQYHRRIQVKELDHCHNCKVKLSKTYGVVRGPNIGARGYRWFKGKGIIRCAKIQTDTFGNDAGSIGGTVQFAEIRVLVECPYATAQTASLKKKVSWLKLSRITYEAP